MVLWRYLEVLITLQDLSVNNIARNINRSSLFFIYYNKKLKRGIINAMNCLFSEEGRIVLGILVLAAGWALGIWAIAIKTSHSQRLRVSVGIVYAIGVPLMIIMRTAIWEDDRYSVPEVANTSFLCAEKVHVAVEMGVGVPALFTLWIWLVQDSYSGEWRCPVIWTMVLLAALASILWPFWIRVPKVSLSAGLGIGLPCLEATIF